MVGNAESDNKNAKSDNKIDLIKMELTNLRAELHDLKTCQIQFVTFAFTASGVILSFRGNFIPLIPLVIILPTWWIFFDKAKSVSRIIGYYRILEKAYLGDVELNFIGWENAQSIYRKINDEKEEQFLVTWDEIHTDEEKLKGFLISKFDNIDWVREAKIESIDKDSIELKSLRNHQYLRLKNAGTKINIEIVDGRSTCLTEDKERKVYGRKYGTEKMKISLREKYMYLLSLKASSYWTLVYFTFFGLGIVCFGLYFLLKINTSENIFSWLLNILNWLLSSSIQEKIMSFLNLEMIVTLVIISIFSYSAHKNIRLLLQLIWGEHSYDANQLFWEEILNVKEIDKKIKF